jgi:hypothetical protein
MLISSQGMSQGLQQTTGVQVLPRVTLRAGDVTLGALWRNISNPSATGVAAFYARVARPVGKAQVEIGAAYRIRTGAEVRRENRAWEYSAALRHTIGKVALRLIAEYSPREFDSGYSLYVEGGAGMKVSRRTSLAVNIGKRERNGGADYTAFNAGISRILAQGLTVDARYYATNRPSVGSRYHSRLILSARVTL